MLDRAGLVLPAAAPFAGHGDEGLVGVVIVHQRALARLGPAIAEIEAFADLDRGEPRRVVADRRGDRPARTLRRLKADDVVERALAARHLAVGQPAVGAFEILEARHPLHHVGPRDLDLRQRFHPVSPSCLIDVPR